jgi:hypothetical protein
MTRVLFVVFALCAASAGAQPSVEDVRRADALFQSGDHKGAAAAYEALVRVAPDSRRFWYRLGASANALRDDERAAHAFARVAAFGRNALAAFNAGAVFARMGRADTAFAWLRRAAATGAFGPDTFTADADLAGLRGDARWAPLLDSARRAWEPCAYDANARRFDFWVGDWEVRTAQGGQVAGENRIEKVSGSCAILENWTSRGGGTGKSLNFYNAQAGQWQQYWVGQGGATQYTASAWDGPTLRFVAEGTRPDGTPIKQRLSFTPIARDTVRQHGETSADGGRTWSTQYDFIYVRKR